MANILFIKSNNSSFILFDEHLLKKHHTLKCYLFLASNKFLKLFMSQIKLFLWLFSNIDSSELLYIWFADYHSLLPVLLAKLFSKKSIIVVGGFDVARIEEIRYGGHVKVIRSLHIRFSFYYASYLLPVSKFIEKELIKYNRRTPRSLVYNVVDPQQFYRTTSINKQKMVLTVGIIKNKWIALNKGIDLYLQAASKLPEIRFVVVSIEPEAESFIQSLHPVPNVEIKSRITRDELMILYNQAQVYCQFSHFESFCLSLAEAMLCECIPVITRNGALPEVIGDNGFVVETRNPEQISLVIQQAMKLGQSERTKARQWIEQNFNPQYREHHLNQIITTLITGK